MTDKVLNGSVVNAASSWAEKRTYRDESWIIGIVFITYILFLIEGLVFKFQIGIENIYDFGRTSFEFEWNPRLGWATLSSYNLHAHLEVWGNLVIFIPFGCFFAMDKKAGWWHILDAFVIMTFSIFIELSQAVFFIGMGDIRDIILNTSGGVMGIYIYKLLRAIFKKHALTVFAVVLGACMVTLTLMGVLYVDWGAF